MIFVIIFIIGLYLCLKLLAFLIEAWKESRHQSFYSDLKEDARELIEKGIVNKVQLLYDIEHVLCSYKGWDFGLLYDTPEDQDRPDWVEALYLTSDVEEVRKYYWSTELDEIKSLIEKFNVSLYFDEYLILDTIFNELGLDLRPHLDRDIVWDEDIKNRIEEIFEKNKSNIIISKIQYVISEGMRGKKSQIQFLEKMKGSSKKLAKKLLDEKLKEMAIESLREDYVYFFINDIGYDSTGPDPEIVSAYSHDINELKDWHEENEEKPWSEILEEKMNLYRNSFSLDTQSEYNTQFEAMKKDALLFGYEKEGTLSSWYKDGSGRWECEYDEWTNKNGKFISWDESEQKSDEGTYKDGKQDGLWTEWHDNGQKQSEKTYKDGERIGLWIEWHDNGQMSLEGTYKDGEQDGLFTQWYENGQKESESIYKDGKQDGLEPHWYENGQMQSEETYKDGEWISEKKWNEDGSVKE